MARRTLKNVFRASLALSLSALVLGAAAPARARPFLFFFDWPPQRQPFEREAPRLSVRQVRGILAREGAHMIGAPHQRSGQVIAIGRIRSGARMKFILDARNGALLAVVELTPAPRRRHHVSRSRERAPRPGGEIVVLPPPASPPPGRTADNKDAALSPTRPMHRSGGPEIDPLPQ